MLILGNDEINQLVSMRTCIKSLEDGFHELSIRDAVGMGRMDVYVPSSNNVPYYRWAVMAGGSRKNGIVCARMLSEMVDWPKIGGTRREEKHAREPGTYCGLLILFSVEDATPIAIMHDGYLQQLRSGAAAGLGAKLLSRPESTTVGMIGSGGKARSYLEALCAVRPITHVKVFSPTLGNREKFAEEMRDLHHVDVVPVSSAREAIGGVDIVSCCASSIEPIMHRSAVEPGMHITDVGKDSTEPGFADAVDLPFRLGESTPELARVPREAQYAAHGFLGYIAGTDEERQVIPNKGFSTELARLPEIADLIAGRAVGRQSPEESSWVLNIGAMGIIFASVAAEAYRRAVEAGVGESLETDVFLQEIRS